jgi:hypothetical protein
MKTKLNIFYILSALLFTGIFAIAAHNNSISSPKDNKFISIAKLLEEKKLSVKIYGTGGYQENCIEFDLKNTDHDTVFIIIEAGRRLISKDTSLQDIFIVKEQKLFLAPNQRLKIPGYGFCCEASMHSPTDSSIFGIGFMAPPDWIKLAQVINRNNFPAEAVQSAVWVISDNNSIASIYYEKMEEIDSLLKTVASIKGVEIPKYNIIYEKDTAMVCSQRPERVKGNIDYVVRSNVMITINVRNKNGRLMKNLVPEGATQGPGTYNYKYDIDVKGWPKGEYEIYIYEDYSRLIKKSKFEI